MTFPIQPSIFHENPYQWEWYARDYLFTPDGNQEYPDHHCKLTWMASLPFIIEKRNAVDVGCRDGEYTRYLHKDFNHVYCFEYRTRKLFARNVDLSKITHFKCALGQEHKIMKVSGASSITSTSRIPKEKWHDEQIYTLDEFNLSNIDYIKIDVDGHEVSILQGAVNTIKKYSPLIVLEQENGDTRGIDYCITTFNYEVAAWDKLNRNVIMRKKQ